jgi:hypothetical protein
MTGGVAVVYDAMGTRHPSPEEADQAADAARMAWLAKQWEDGGAISADRYGPGRAGCQLFTVASQHVRGYGLRGAIDAAMAVANHNAGKTP